MKQQSNIHPIEVLLRPLSNDVKGVISMISLNMALLLVINNVVDDVDAFDKK
jgi:hypothetical protein